jgi:hypothetical protein
MCLGEVVGGHLEAAFGGGNDFHYLESPPLLRVNVQKCVQRLTFSLVADTLNL